MGRAGCGLLKRAGSFKSVGSIGDGDTKNTQTNDDIDLTPYARKFPKLQKTGVRETDSLLPTFEATIKKIISKLQSDPQQSLAVWAQLSTGTLADGIRERNDEYWGDSYTKIWRLPKYFFVGVLVRLSDLTIDDLDAIDAKDGEAIRNICDGFFQIRQHDVLPPALKHKALCFAVFKERGEQCGARYSGWKAECLKEDGTINHWAAGPYRFRFNEVGILTEIVHKGSKLSVTLETEGVTKEWKVDDPYHETATELKHGAKRIHIASLFAHGVGPWQFHIPDASHPQKPNSFRDLAVARKASGNYGTEIACEETHTLVQAKQRRIDKLKELAKTRGSTKRMKCLDF